MDLILPRVTAEHVFTSLREENVVVLPFLRPEARKLLLMEAESSYTYRQAPYEVGPRRVRQRMEEVARLPQRSHFWALNRETQEWLDALAMHEVHTGRRNPFEQPLLFGVMRLQRYPEGRVGIEPHRDLSKFRNVIAVVMLKGEAQLTICDDDKTPLHRLTPQPGELILLRAPGLFGSERRPYHAVENVTSERIVCTMCCEREQSEAD